MSEPVSCNEQPVYQLHKFYGWQDIDEQMFDSCTSAPKSPVRKLYLASTYEAQRNEVERLKAENEALKRAQSKDAVDYWDLVSANADRAKSIADLKAENAAQAKRIAEIEATLEDIAESKPRLMQSDFGHEFFCYQYNPTEKARKALFASKLSAASKRSDKSKNGDSK